MFSTFLQCSRMCGVLYDSVIHGLSFFICFMIKILCAARRNNKSHRSTNWHNLITLKCYKLSADTQRTTSQISSKKMFFAISKCLLEEMWWKTIKHPFSMFYTHKTWVFDQSERDDLPRLCSSHRKLPKRLLVPASTYIINLRNTLLLNDETRWVRPKFNHDFLRVARREGGGGDRSSSYFTQRF